MRLPAEERIRRLDALYGDYCAISESAALLVKELKTETDFTKQKEILRRIDEHDQRRMAILEQIGELWEDVA